MTLNLNRSWKICFLRFSPIYSGTQFPTGSHIPVFIYSEVCIKITVHFSENTETSLAKACFYIHQHTWHFGIICLKIVIKTYHGSITHIATLLYAHHQTSLEAPTWSEWQLHCHVLIICLDGFVYSRHTSIENWFSTLPLIWYKQVV